jgi:hypothetical protein
MPVIAPPTKMAATKKNRFIGNSLAALQRKWCTVVGNPCPANESLLTQRQCHPGSAWPMEKRKRFLVKYL